MSEKVCPPEIDKELYNKFKKYWIGIWQRAKTLEEAIQVFIKEGAKK